MAFSNHQLNDIYDRTSGYCHICRKKLAFNNYGINGTRGAWEVEHSKPKSKGGTNYLRNLYSACILCNRAKGNNSTRSARGKCGNRKAPLSTTKRKQAKTDNAIVGAIIGGLIGSAFSSKGSVLGTLVGAKLGYDKNPDED